MYTATTTCIEGLFLKSKSSPFTTTRKVIVPINKKNKQKEIIFILLALTAFIIKLLLKYNYCLIIKSVYNVGIFLFDFTLSFNQCLSGRRELVVLVYFVDDVVK